MGPHLRSTDEVIHFHNEVIVWMLYVEALSFRLRKLVFRQNDTWISFERTTKAGDQNVIWDILGSIQRGTQRNVFQGLKFGRGYIAIDQESVDKLSANLDQLCTQLRWTKELCPKACRL